VQVRGLAPEVSGATLMRSGTASAGAGCPCTDSTLEALFAPLAPVQLPVAAASLTRVLWGLPCRLVPDNRAK
jgi:hypothetical protein